MTIVCIFYRKYLSTEDALRKIEEKLKEVENAINAKIREKFCSSGDDFEDFAINITKWIIAVTQEEIIFGVDVEGPYFESLGFGAKILPDELKKHFPTFENWR